MKKRLEPEDITEEMLNGLPKRTKDKPKPKTDEDKKKSSSCHQCRQNTMDLKSVCRNPKKSCPKKYCAICLRNIYGQDLRAVLMDAEWACPFCHDKCQCSPCMKAKGLEVNGQLVKEARAKGFDSVIDYKEYLASNKASGKADEASERKEDQNESLNVSSVA